MTPIVTGQVPITKDLSLAFQNRTEPGPGSRNWTGNDKRNRNNSDPPGFFEAFLPAVGQGLGQALGLAATLAVLALF